MSVPSLSALSFALAQSPSGAVLNPSWVRWKLDRRSEDCVGPKSGMLLLLFLLLLLASLCISITQIRNNRLINQKKKKLQLILK